MAATIPQIELALKGRGEWARMTSPFGGSSRPGRSGKGGKQNAAPCMVGEGLPAEDRRREVARHMRLFAMTHNKLRVAGH